MSTSGLETYLTPQNIHLIDEAFERIGVVPALETQQKVLAASRSANFLLTSWLNRGVNLFTVQNNVLTLNANQAAYMLPPDTVQVLEVVRRESIRVLSGVAFSSSGVAQNAFDGDPLTACIQTAPNGTIGYQWSPGANTITFVGVTSSVDNNYTLTFEYSNDGITYYPVLVLPTQAYAAGVLTWFIIPVFYPGIYFRMRETGGATLNIQELYFNNILQDLVMTPFSRAEYTQQPNKTQLGTPTSFYFDRQISPMIYIWQTPLPQYNAIYYTRTVSIQDFGTLINSPQVPNRFLEALSFGISHRLAMKYERPLAMVQMLEQQYEKELALARKSDYENVPLRIYGSYQDGWTQV